MIALAKTIPEAAGDWQLRGLDIDTRMVSETHDTLIDADAMVRRRWSNGFPNWELYRYALCGDPLTAELREWVEAFCCAAMPDVLKRTDDTDEVAMACAWDALHGLRRGIWLFTASTTAAALGVTSKTYSKARRVVWARLHASVLEYWMRLGSAYREVILLEREFQKAESGCNVKVRGRYGPQSGNWITNPNHASHGYRPDDTD